MNKIAELKESWLKIRTERTLSGPEALKAVKQNGSTLLYVKDQTEVICIEAVKQDGYTLRYVSDVFFS